LTVVVLALAAVAFTASPAAAHDLGGRQPTDIRSRVVAIRPDVPRVTVRVVDLGGRIELRNDSSVDVVVIGYDGEPYLRIGPEGTFVNERSPALFLNKTADPQTRVPAGFDADAPPEWRRVSATPEARWHDHRAHATRATLEAGPVQWQIDMTVDGKPVFVEGESVLIDAPPWWPWMFLTAAVAVSLVVAARQWWRRTLILALTTLGIAGTVQLVGGWSQSAGTTTGRIAAMAMPALAIGLAIIAIERLMRRRDSAAVWTLLAAVVLLVALGLADILDLFRSQLPTSLPAALVRTIVALEIGGAIGAGIAAARRLRVQPPSLARQRDDLGDELALGGDSRVAP
jgi:hypothetical protein